MITIYGHVVTWSELWTALSTVANVVALPLVWGFFRLRKAERAWDTYMAAHQDVPETMEGLDRRVEQMERRWHDLGPPPSMPDRRRIYLRDG